MFYKKIGVQIIEDAYVKRVYSSKLEQEENRGQK